MKNKLFILSVVLFISSCSFYSGHFGSISTFEHENETWVDIAISRSVTLNFLGLGGNKKTALYADLKNEILFIYKDSLNHSLRNFTLSQKRVYFFPFIKTIYYMTADVYRHKSPKDNLTNLAFSLIDNTDSLSGIYKPTLPPYIKCDMPYQLRIGETINFCESFYPVQLQRGKIISLEKSRALVATYSANGKLIIRRVKYYFIFKLQQKLINMKVGELSIGGKAIFPIVYPYSQVKTRAGTALYINHDAIIYEDENGTMYYITASDYFKPNTAQNQKQMP